MLYPTIGIPFMGTGIFRRYDQYQYTRCLQRAGATVQTLALHAFSGAVDAALENATAFCFPADRISSRNVMDRTACRPAGNRNLPETILSFFCWALRWRRRNRCSVSEGACSF